MARSMWTGVVSFGLVAVPVKLYSATKDHDVSFHQFEEGTKDRIRYQRVNERTGKEVDYSDIVKGAETDDGYVMVDSDELDSVAPGRSRVLEIHTFVEQADIDPVHYQKAYYLGPGTDETSRTYALLRDAMAKADRVAIGTLVMRGKEYLAAIRPRDDILVLETMYFADEIRDPDELLDSVPGRAKGKPNELKTAVQLIDSMTGPWQPEEFRDTYTDRVNELIEAKRKGNEVTVADEAPAATNVVDLMSALRASVEAAKKGRGGGAKKTASAKKAAPTKKTAPAKKAASSKKTAPAKKSAPAKKATSAKRAAPAKKAASTKTTTKKAATKKAAPTKRSAAKKTSPAKGTRRKAA